MARDKQRGPALALPTLLAALQDAAQVLEHGEVDVALLRAQLGDRCRDAGVEPVATDGFDAAVETLGAEGWRRFSALVSQWNHPEIEPILTAILRVQGAGPVLATTLSVVRHKSLLTMTLLRTSALRVEELGRAWLGEIGIAIAGETPAQSSAALVRLDYERLLETAGQARLSAEARMEQLKQAQKAEDQARAPRRGKS